MSGAARLAMRTNEWHDTSMALAKPSAEQSSSPPCRSSFGANAIECSLAMPTTSARLSFRIGRTASVVIVVFSSERVERRLGLLRREGYVAGLARCLRFGDEIRRAAALDPGADERARGLDVLAAWRLNVLPARRLNVLPARGLNVLATWRLNVLAARRLKVLPGADECARGLNVL